MIKAVIFDMGGLMFDTESLSQQIWRQLGKENGYFISDKLFDQLTGSNLNKTKEIFRNNFGSDFPYLELRSKKQKIMLAEIENKGVPLKPGLKSCLNYLKDNDFILAVASSSQKSVIDFYLANADLEVEFDYIIGGDQVKHSKPDPEIFEQCRTEIAVPAAETIILEDSLNGVKAAVAAGIKVILVPDLVKIPAEVEALTFATLSNLTELAPLLDDFNHLS